MSEPMSDERLARLAADNKPTGDHLSGLTADEVAELLAEVQRQRFEIARANQEIETLSSEVEAEHREAEEVHAELDAARDHAQTAHDQTAELGGHVVQLRAELAESLDALTVATELIDRLTDDGTCDYDHHDNCRTHGLQRRPCPHPLGRQFVEAWRAVEAEQQEATSNA